jgi:tetratricopeptide (TPR) repeat protein
VAGALACTSDEARRDEHLAKASEYMEKGQYSEALLELRSALKLDPQNPEINYRIADAFELALQFPDALFFFGEARRLDPSNTDAALREASLLLFDDVERAEKIVAEVLEKEPGNDFAYVVRSRLELAKRNPDAALQAALTAVELDPDTHHTFEQLGKVHQARIRQLQAQEEEVPDEIFEAALAAFDKAVAVSPDLFRWRLHAERGKLYAAWAGHRVQAVEAYRQAVLGAEAQGPNALREALALATRYAATSRDAEFASWALERHVALAPDALSSWTSLAAIEQRREGGDAGAVMKRMLEAQPDNPEAHVLYARFLLSDGKPEEAIAYLEGAAERGIEPPVVLAALANVLHGLRRPDEAAALTDRLLAEHPDHPRTTLARAQTLLNQGKPAEAAAVLRELVAKSESAEAQRLLAAAERLAGNLPGARAAIERAVRLAGQDELSDQSHRLRIELLIQSGDCQGALSSFAALRQGEGLLEEPLRVRLAHCLYQTGRGEMGRRILGSILEKEDPPLAAVLEFASRERERRPERVQKLLEAAFARHPDNPRLVVELSRLDLAKRDPRRALERLNGLMAERQVGPEVVLQRARVLAAMGDLETAQRDAMQAFTAAPGLPGATALVVQLYYAQGKVDEVIASFEQAEAAGALTAPARLVLAQLHLGQRNEARATELLEKVVAERSDLPAAKNDLAFLLAKKDGGDLDRALRLAQDAMQGLSDRPEVADTLGFVYLKKGLYEPAVQQFRYAIELAESSGEVPAALPYHLGLALARLGLGAAAEEAFERTLSIDAKHTEAAAELEKLRRQAATQEASAS